jgi:chromosome segregation ATPase
MAKKNQIPKRSTQDVRNEYLQLCAQAGEAQYKISEFQKALSNLNDKIIQLNREFSELSQKEQKKVLKPAPVVAEVANDEE